MGKLYPLPFIMSASAHVEISHRIVRYRIVYYELSGAAPMGNYYSIPICDSNRFDSLCESIRFVKKSAFRFISCHAVFFLIYCIVSAEKNKLTSLFAAFNTLEHRQKRLRNAYYKKLLLTYYLNISVEAANLSDCQIKSKKNRFGSENRMETFFARIGMLYSVDTDEYFHQIATLMLSVMILLYGVFYDLFPQIVNFVCTVGHYLCIFRNVIKHDL